VFIVTQYENVLDVNLTDALLGAGGAIRDAASDVLCSALR
jgi:hypothetical protein